MMPLTMLTLLMIPAGLKSSLGGNHDNYIVNNENVFFYVDVDVIDDT